MPEQGGLFDNPATSANRSGAWQNIELPQGDVRLQPCFLDDHRRWFERLSTSLDWLQPEVKVFGKRHKVPRLTAFYGDAGVSYRYSGLQHRALIWQQGLDELRTRVERACQTQFPNVAFNSVLVNYYRDGEDCMGMHRDNEPELGQKPLIASLSLGASCRFAFKPVTAEPSRGPSSRIELIGGSLLLMAGDTQSHYLHGVARQKHRGPRINLSFRFIHG